VGLLRREQNGRGGFRVLVGGGTSTMVRSGAVLFDFLPVDEMFDVAEAIVRVFHKLGDYKNKHKNRMKFLIKALGWERWREQFDCALAEVRAEGGSKIRMDPSDLNAVK